MLKGLKILCLLSLEKTLTGIVKKLKAYILERNSGKYLQVHIKLKQNQYMYIHINVSIINMCVEYFMEKLGLMFDKLWLSVKITT